MDEQNKLVSAPQLRELCKLRPARTFCAFAFDWLLIAAAITASEYARNPFVYLAAIMLIGGRMHGFGVLMHEAAHYRMVRNRFAGDWISDIFAAWPIMVTTDGYRRNHLAHHRFANTDDDPDWVSKIGDPAFTFPQKLRRLALRIAGYLLAVNSVRDIASIFPRLAKCGRSTLRYKLLRASYYGAWAALFTVLGIWKGFLLYWAVPFLTMLFMFQHIRSVAEHFARMDYSHELTSTRTVRPYFWERWFFAPHNINYHLEHHLYPGVPFYNLPKLHGMLMRNARYRERAHVTRGYSTGLLAECLS